MLHSMTGFGAAHRHDGVRVLSIEARSVNHRYCDVRFNLARDLEPLAHELEPVVRERIRRGRVDVSVVVGFSTDAIVEPAVDIARAKGFRRAFEELATGLGMPLEVSLTTIAQSSGVLRAPEARLDPADDMGLLRETLIEAIESLVRMRQAEGAQLATVVERHLHEIVQLRARITELVPQAVEERQAKLRKRIDELLAERSLDEARIAQEVAILAERADVTEETDRLQSHVEQFRRLLGDSAAVGRKMDFLIQEMNREANTVGSKCSHAAVAHLVVDLKAELERLREQVQNVE